MAYSYSWYLDAIPQEHIGPYLLPGSAPGVLWMHPILCSSLAVMREQKRQNPPVHLCLLLFVGLLLSPSLPAQSTSDNNPAASQRAVLWTDPGDIRARDLFYGPGGKEHLPQLPVKFVAEVSGGGNPKFDVVDDAGRKWRAKLGLEAQPEVVATRLLWAVGYIANENYFVRDLSVSGLPSHLHRGQKFVSPGGHVRAVRLQEHPPGTHKGKREGTWKWRKNPFRGTREFDGLRVMMALISNWDLVTGNTAIREGKHGEELYEVSDVGSSFGRNGRGFSDVGSKNNLEAYRKSKFLGKVTPDYVDFSFPSLPPILYVFDLKLYVELGGPHWIGRHIPRHHVQWIAGLLSQLSPQQIRDAFRAAGYTPEQIEQYSAAVEERIASLRRLSTRESPAQLAR